MKTLTPHEADVSPAAVTSESTLIELIRALKPKSLSLSNPPPLNLNTIGAERIRLFGWEEQTLQQFEWYMSPTDQGDINTIAAVCAGLKTDQTLLSFTLNNVGCELTQLADFLVDILNNNTVLRKMVIKTATFYVESGSSAEDAVIEQCKEIGVRLAEAMQTNTSLYLFKFDISFDDIKKRTSYVKEEWTQSLIALNQDLMDRLAENTLNRSMSFGQLQHHADPSNLRYLFAQPKIILSNERFHVTDGLTNPRILFILWDKWFPTLIPMLSTVELSGINHVSDIVVITDFVLYSQKDAQLKSINITINEVVQRNPAALEAASMRYRALSRRLYDGTMNMAKLNVIQFNVRLFESGSSVFIKSINIVSLKETLPLPRSRVPALAPAPIPTNNYVPCPRSFFGYHPTTVSQSGVTNQAHLTRRSGFFVSIGSALFSGSASNATIRARADTETLDNSVLTGQNYI